jgi:hypothetical protein
MRYTTLLITTIFSLLLLVACDNNQPAPTNTDLNQTRAIETHSQQVQFNGKVINLNTEDIIGTASQLHAEEADAKAMMDVNAAFLSAEKEAQALDVNFSMADEPVDNGMFIFGIETKEAKQLKMEVFDEEGFAMVANNEFDITEGNNYKALNVRSLDNGTYTFRIKDDQGKELNRKMVVQQ